MSEPITVITLSSEFCSRGRFIAQAFSRLSGFTYYDDQTLLRLLDGSEKLIENLKLLDQELSVNNVSIDTLQRIFTFNAHFIKAINLAVNAGPCIIHERAGSKILGNHPGRLSVMIQANDMELKLRYAHLDPNVNSIQEFVDHVPDEEKERIAKYIHAQDNIRRNYHNALSTKPWDDRRSYDLIINSDCFSIEQCAQFLANLVNLNT